MIKKYIALKWGYRVKHLENCRLKLVFMQVVLCVMNDYNEGWMQIIDALCNGTPFTNGD